MSFDCQLSSSLRQSSITDQYLHMRYIYVHIVDGRNPAPVDNYFVQLFLGLYTSQVVNRISLFHGSYIYIYFNQNTGSVVRDLKIGGFQA